MPTIDYKPVAAGVGANVVTQGAYVILLGVGGALQNGYQAGTAQSNQINKTLRQTSMAASALATAISEILGVDVLDDGDLPALTAKVKAAFTAAAFTTGDGKLTLKNVADTGWVLANDGTIGNAGSGASTRANADTLALYSLLWNNVDQTYATVSTGRGANPAADFAALKTITLTKQLGRSILIAGAGAGLTVRSLGESGGFESQTIAKANLPNYNLPHTLTVPLQLVLQQLGGTPANVAVAGTTGVNGNVSLDGGGQALSTMDPFSAWNIMIKL